MPLVVDGTLGSPGGGPLVVRGLIAVLLVSCDACDAELRRGVSTFPRGDFGAFGTNGDFCTLDFRLGIDVLALAFPAVARTGNLGRPPLVDLVKEGREPDSDAVLDVPDVSSACCRLDSAA